MSIPELIRTIRLKLCLEQKEFAQKLGVSPAAICNYERGLRVPRLPTIRKIKLLVEKNKLKVSMDDFFN